MSRRVSKKFGSRRTLHDTIMSDVNARVTNVECPKSAARLVRSANRVHLREFASERCADAVSLVYLRN
jgi:hypothetical protein